MGIGSGRWHMLQQSQEREAGDASREGRTGSCLQRVGRQEAGGGGGEGA